MTADETLHAIPRLDKPPDEAQLRAISDSVLADLLVRLLNSQIAQKRNDIVHKHAYRPGLEEVEEVQKETRELVFALGSKLCELP